MTNEFKHGYCICERTVRYNKDGLGDLLSEIVKYVRDGRDRDYIRNRVVYNTEDQFNVYYNLGEYLYKSWAKRVLRPSGNFKDSYKPFSKDEVYELLDNGEIFDVANQKFVTFFLSDETKKFIRKAIRERLEGYASNYMINKVIKAALRKPSSWMGGNPEEDDDESCVFRYYNNINHSWCTNIFVDFQEDMLRYFNIRC